MGLLPFAVGGAITALSSGGCARRTEQSAPVPEIPKRDLYSIEEISKHPQLLDRVDEAAALGFSNPYSIGLGRAYGGKGLGIFARPLPDGQGLFLHASFSDRDVLGKMQYILGREAGAGNLIVLKTDEDQGYIEAVMPASGTLYRHVQQLLPPTGYDRTNLPKEVTIVPWDGFGPSTMSAEGQLAAAGYSHGQLSAGERFTRRFTELLRESGYVTGDGKPTEQMLEAGPKDVLQSVLGIVHNPQNMAYDDYLMKLLEDKLKGAESVEDFGKTIYWWLQDAMNIEGHFVKGKGVCHHYAGAMSMGWDVCARLNPDLAGISVAQVHGEVRVPFDNHIWDCVRYSPREGVLVATYMDPTWDLLDAVNQEHYFRSVEP